MHLAGILGMVSPALLWDGTNVLITVVHVAMTSSHESPGSFLSTFIPPVFILFPLPSLQARDPAADLCRFVEKMNLYKSYHPSLLDTS